MTDLVVIRHGETDWNRQLRFQGQIDVPLNAAGEEQAQRLARRLAREKFDAVLASDLQRAHRTAELAAAKWKLPIQTSPLWREQAFGILEGLDGPSIRAKLPDLWAAWRRHEADYALPDGGESVRSFHARVNQALAATVKAFPGQRVAVFSHGGVLDMLWRTAHELPLDGERECPIPNTGINELRWKDGLLTVLRWADDEHLRKR
ncbi:fructose-2,6-bisphosphatase [Burkholderiales bacterium JOSHI_001]|nr:fructose-2,6-bisphosphatase [Burkholderiales bacterium JOSHI_001]